MQKIITNKFLDTSISVRSLLPFEKENLTALNVAVLMMKMKTEKFSDKRSISIALNTAYGFRCSIRLTGLGNQLLLDQRFQFLNTKVLPKNLDPSLLIELMDQFLFHTLPDLSSFEESKFLLKERFMRLHDDADATSITECLACLDSKHTASCSILGCEEQVDTITYEEAVEQLHRIWNTPKEVYICGELSEDIERYLSSFDKHIPSLRSSNLYPQGKLAKKVLSRQVSQTSLALAYSTGIDVRSTQTYAQTLFSSILGQCPDNLLFHEVREVRSLCYSIYSSLIRYDGLLLIQSGIQKKDLDSVLKLIDKQIDAIKEGNYTDTLLDHAKKDWIDSLKSQNDYPFSMINYCFSQNYLQQFSTFDEEVQKIQNVTKEEIASVAIQLHKEAFCVVEGEDI